MNKRSTLIAWAVAACLSACGGGGTDTGSSGTGVAPTPSTPIANTAPVANAGLAQSVMAGASPVTLDGSGSTDPNGDQITYRWRFLSVPTASIEQPFLSGSVGSSFVNVAKPTIFANVPGVYVVELIVNDGKIDSAPATVTITAASANAAPVANAGLSQNVSTGTLVTLDGSASSDANGDALTYAWAFTSRPAGSASVLGAPNSAKPTFTADATGLYTVALTVNDGKIDSPTVMIAVNSASANVAPVANAGVAQDFVAGANISLDGSSSSDANGDILSYAWVMTSRPAGSTATLLNPTVARPTFVADIPGSYVAALTVNDGRLSSAPSTVMATAKGVAFSALQGSWKAIANANNFVTDSTDLTVTLSAGKVTIRAAQFFDGTCIYTASLTAAGDGVTSGTYSCSNSSASGISFKSGDWQLLDMRRNDTGDIYVRLLRDGISLKRIYGLNPNGSAAAQVLPVSISSLQGSFEGVTTGGPFGTQSSGFVRISQVGSTLTMSIDRFYSGGCTYTATVSENGINVTNTFYQCTDFTTGTWSLLDLRSVGGSDVFISLLANGEVRRTYGMR